MALLKCRECGGKVSSSAPACPHCGALPSKDRVSPRTPPPPKKKGKFGCCAGIAVLAVLLFGAIFVAAAISAARDAREAAKQEELQRERAEQEHQAFITGIDAQYARLSEFAEAGDLPKAIAVLDLFQKHGSMTHEDVAELNRVVRTAHQLRSLESIPESSVGPRLAAYQNLARMNPDVSEYSAERDRYAALRSEQLALEKEAALQAERERREAEELAAANEAKIQAERERLRAELERQQSEERRPRQRNWYEGGTLHDATGKKWRRATSRNKRATAADLVAGMYRTEHGTSYPHSLDDLKERADALVLGLDEATKGGVADTLSVAELAAAIWVLAPALSEK